MDFKRVPPIPTPQELLGIAFRRAEKESRKATGRGARERSKKREALKVKAASRAVRSTLVKVIKRIPSLENLPPFYKELIGTIVDRDRMRKSLGAIQWVSDTTLRLEGDYLRRIRTSRTPEEPQAQRRGFYGRLASILKQVSGDLQFLAEAREKLKNLPTPEETFTAVIAGAPNVGKSSLLRAMTTARPRVESYPFTTQSIMLGYFERRHLRYQVIDTPGLLDRSLERRSTAERQAVLALKHLADAVLFLFDLSGSSGYPVEEQMGIFREVSEAFDTEVIPVVSKADLLKEEEIEKFQALLGKEVRRCSALTKDGVEELTEMLVALRKA